MDDRRERYFPETAGDARLRDVVTTVLVEDATLPRPLDHARAWQHVMAGQTRPVSPKDRTGWRLSAGHTPAAAWRWRMAGGVAVMAVALIVLAVPQFLRPSARYTFAHTYETRTGERMDLTLPDGSRVILAPESRLAYRMRPTGARTVQLAGQAYFDVVESGVTPFVIQTGSISTEVLGTRFYLRRYQDDAQADITVASGKVALRAARAHVVLSVGMAAKMTDSTITPVPAVPEQQAAAWLDGRLVFKDAPVPTVLRTLERWSGYQYQLADTSILHERITTVLRVDDIRRTMQMLEELLDVSGRVNGRTVLLQRRQRVQYLRPTRLPAQGTVAVTERNRVSSGRQTSYH